MKATKFLSIVFCCLAAVSVTSCLGDDSKDNNALTDQEKAQCLAVVKGDYTGKLVYPTTETKDGKAVSDTIDAKWSIASDNKLIIKAFPTRLLAEHVTDSTVKEALASANDIDIECYIGFINVSPVQYLINPQTPSYTVNYGDKEHKIQVPFLASNYYSFGSYDQTQNLMEMQIIEAGLYIDGQLTDYLTTSIPFAFYSKK